MFLIFVWVCLSCFLLGVFVFCLSRELCVLVWCCVFVYVLCCVVCVSCLFVVAFGGEGLRMCLCVFFLLLLCVVWCCSCRVLFLLVCIFCFVVRFWLYAVLAWFVVVVCLFSYSFSFNIFCCFVLYFVCALVVL